MNDRETRRVVAWADYSSDGAAAMRWAAQHARTRRLPLHLVQFPRALPAVPAGDGHGPALGQPDPTAAAALALMYALRRIYARHQDLEVTTQLVLDGSPRPGPASLRRGDVLVTGPIGYIDLAEHAPATADVQDAVGTPIVVVPAKDALAGGAARDVVLLAGEQLSEQAAAFAFETAEDLGARLDVVRAAVEGRMFGEGSAVSPAEAAELVQQRLRTMIEEAAARYRAVTWSVSTLRSAPWLTFRAITRAAQLTVLPHPAEPDEDVRRLLFIAASPLALVPTRGVPQ